MVAGIYKIENKIDGKVYIGKSICIEDRFRTHRWALSREHNDDQQASKYLFKAVKKHGLENFTFDIVEEVPISDKPEDREYLSEREIYYIDYYDSCNSDKGYNLCRVSPTIFATKDETRKLLSENMQGEGNPNYGNRWTEEQKQSMSIIKKQQFSNGTYDWMKTEEWKNKLSENASNLWKDEEKKKTMALKVAAAKSQLRFYEYDKNTHELKRVWESMSEIIQAHPDYFRIAIYSVCNGYKKSYRGSIWRSEEKYDTLQD